MTNENPTKADRRLVLITSRAYLDDNPTALPLQAMHMLFKGLKE